MFGLTALCLVHFLTLGQGAPSKETVTLTPQQFWHMPYGIGDWFTFVGDADGDGHADLLAVSQGADSHIEMARTSPLGKPVINAVAMTGFGANAIAAACGPFKRVNADLAAVFADGTVHVAWGMVPGTPTYLHNDIAAEIRSEDMPKGPVRSAVADFDGDDRSDILLLDANGRMLLLQNTPAPGGGPGFTVHPLPTVLPGVKRLAAGKLGQKTRGELVWLDETGTVWTATVSPKGLGAPVLVTKATPDDQIAVGRFRGAKGADILVGNRLLAGGDPKVELPMKNVPAGAIAKDDAPWMVADVDGNGKDDLIRFRRGKEPFVGQDTFVHFAYVAGKEDPGYYSTANDGIPDVWKTGKIKPEGLDLVAMGCKVGHRDLIVEIERFENVSFPDLRNNLNRAAQYYASVPLVNPDGSTGITLHVLYREPYPMKDHDRIRNHFNDIFPRPGNRGIAHMMFAENDGPLDAAIDASVGRFNGGWAVFVHEIGHQLDLNHNGFYGGSPGWPSDTGSAIYPSLMSYTYSYGLNNTGESIGYSDGARASLVLQPQHLSERLPFPIDKVQFLSAEPYHYRLQPSPDGKSTLIDWNWNGILGEEDVQACINYTHGIDFGPQFTIAKTETAPAIVVHGGARPRPVVVYSQGPTLAVRGWMGSNRDADGSKWSDPAVDYAAGIIGDATAAYLGEGVTWITYPTAKGVMLRPVTVDGVGHPRLGTPNLLPDTLHAQPTVTTLNGQLALFLWRSKSLPVGLSMLHPKGEGFVMGRERSLDLISDVPLGAVAGRVGPDGPTLWVGRIVIDGQPDAGRTELIRYVVRPDGGSKVAGRTWVEGTYARHRMTLLWREEGDKLPEGRIIQITGGIGPGGAAGTDQYLTINTPYPDFHNGWLYRRYQNPDFTSLSAASACFFEGDILYAIRRYGGGGSNDSLNVAFYGSGATPWPTGDFDDLGHIRDFGLSHSIRELADRPPVAKPVKP